MAVSLLKKIIRGHPYWYARECQRVNGKPKIVWQKYLGRAEDIAMAMGAPSQIPEPKELVLSDFAAPAALYDLTQKLDLVPAIDRHAGKRAWTCASWGGPCWYRMTFNTRSGTRSILATPTTPPSSPPSPRLS